MNWDEYFIKMAELAATKSKDRSKKVGCVLVSKEHAVLGCGFNGFPIGVNDDVEARHQRPLKYAVTEHAERNSIYLAARNGVKTLGATMYLSCGANTCSDCARAIIQAGIVEIVGVDIPFDGKGSQWEESCRIGDEMLRESGIKVVKLDKDYKRRLSSLGAFW